MQRQDPWRKLAHASEKRKLTYANPMTHSNLPLLRKDVGDWGRQNFDTKSSLHRLSPLLSPFQSLTQRLANLPCCILPFWKKLGRQPASAYRPSMHCNWHQLEEPETPASARGCCITAGLHFLLTKRWAASNEAQRPQFNRKKSSQCYK